MTNITAPVAHGTNQPTLIVVNGSGQPQKIERSLVSSDAAHWTTPPLNRFENPTAQYTFKQAFIEYMSDTAGSITVSVSSDGGKSWTSLGSHAFLDTDEGIEFFTVEGNVTGKDVRLKFDMPTTTTFRLIGIDCVLVQRANPGV